MENIKFIMAGMLGFFLKFYDDLDELYLCKNQKVLELVKQFYSIIICYYIFIISTNIYDLLWVMFFWNFLPIIDWNSYIEFPPSFSLVIFIFCLGIYQIIYKSYYIKV